MLPSIRSNCLRLLAFFFVVCLVRPNGADRLENYEGNAQKVLVGDNDVLNIYQKWVDTGLSSLMAAFANRKLKKHRSVVATKFGRCSSKADSVPKHAKCIRNLIENKQEGKEKPIDRMARYGPAGRRTAEKPADDQWAGGFRVEGRREKRAVRTADRYDIHSTGGRMTPLGGIAKLLMTSVLEQKNKTRTQRWQETVERIKVAGEKKRAMQKRIDEESEESLDQMAFRGIQKQLGKDEGNMDVEMLMKDPTKLNEFVNKAKTKKNRKPLEKVMQLLRDGIKLGYSLSGQNTTDFDTRTMKLVSPRLLGVVPEEKNDDELNLLSPSLFSLHNQGEGLENLTSMSTLLSGMPSRDQQMWLDLIMEASGEVDEAEHQHEEHKNHTGFFDPGSLKDEHGVPLYFTTENATKIGGEFEARKAATFEQLQQMYTKEQASPFEAADDRFLLVQLRELNHTGYVELTEKQLFHLYGPHSPYNNSEALQRFTHKRNSTLTVHDHIETDVKTLSEMENFKIRQKDVVLSPILFTNLVLVPQVASQALILSPLILSPAVFGAVILSPWLFVPLVLSPRVLGALVLSPFLFSPLALHPAILSPGLFNPLVLSPVVLVPFILSPQATLSNEHKGLYAPDSQSARPQSHHFESTGRLAAHPLARPFGLLLSEIHSFLLQFVLSPIIGSPQFLGALILSPYALSPVLFSPLTAFSVILSPSLKKHRTAIADKFGKCSGDADTVPKQAKCLSKLLKNQIVDETTRIERYRKQYGQRARDTAGWTGAFRTKHARRKREIDAQRPRAAATYDLHSAQGRMTPLGGVAKLILESVLAKKNKTEAPKWQTTVQRLRAIGDKKKQLRKEVEESSHESMDQMALRGMRRALKQEDGVDVEELANDPKKMEEFIRDFRHKPNKKPVEKVMDLLRDGMKLGYTLAGQNTTDFDKKTLKVVSPRFFGLIDLLSPSLFSLHNEGKGTENLTSLHNLVRGMPMRDQQVWLDLVMEAAGVNDQSEKLEKASDYRELGDQSINPML
ncbi:hypothetical protein M3Y99_00673100 [Aphelenchoides fujianensis]|nr:hypothetical protein M3Y99_00673100 [Aphelenchoides fujianensis]